MQGIIAVVFATWALVLPSSVWARMNTIDASPVVFLVADSGSMAPDDLARDDNREDVLGDRPTATLAVNGRVLASEGGPGVPIADGWNWTLLLLGCAGLAITRVARRPARRFVIPA